MMLKEGIPRHEQISNWIRDKIESGDYKIDEKLPSENEFKEQFEVSRVTVRRALQTLQNEDLIYRCQGLGSFVKDNRSHQTLVQLTDFVEDMRRAGMEASSTVIRMEPTNVSEYITSLLKLDADKTVLRLDRLRMGDGKPIAFDITWLPMFYGQLIEGYDLTKKTIYGILEQDYDIPIEKGCYRIEAENATDYVATHLGINEGDALLLIDRLSLTVGEKPIYYQKRYYRTDCMVYELMAERKPGTKTSDGNMPLKEFAPVFNKE
ncbi:GntR family transcriptional regulator [Aliifodinibius sp. S!AR15-10]|uniref:GntR family transcriptional regulator n=1 Tax=Aliifodinibius sp. S!AR15-10 TaxID=2950437 RepID=UPI00285CA295|nr:GntR family transcriptional regulator [Aliifodinibius sp. S!AR15-10]MDR8393744.1 GntR family transcriptional regulator [Aliifodinibius sp. S!AR15-10]